MGNQKDKLQRVLQPTSVAVVGLRDGSPYAEFFRPTLDSDVEVFYVNPKHDTVNGEKTYPDLRSLGRSVDVVYCVTNARLAVDVVDEAAALDVGGVVLVSSGYKEVGPEGEALQARLTAAAKSSGIAVIGPNGLGYVNVPRQIALTIASDHKRRPGGISVVSHSGAILSGVAMAAWDRPGVGLNLIISAGNEAVTDLADYVDFLVDDPATTAIGLVIEQVRRPREFLAAARRAILAGKPIVALKLARNARTQELASSHTGAMTGDAWAYDVAFAQLGIGMARDPGDLVDQLAVIEQLGEKYRTKADRLAIVTSTGGYSSLGMDLAVQAGVDVPPLDDLRSWVSDLIPGIHVPNPLDTTPGGLAHWGTILEKYATHPEVDAILQIHPLADEDESVGIRSVLQTYVDTAERFGKPVLITNCEGSLGAWAQEIVDAAPGAAAGRGPVGTLAGLKYLSEFSARRALVTESEPVVAALDRPEVPVVEQAEGPMLPFAAAMELLEANGIPVAPYEIIREGEAVAAPAFPGPYVVKLADVAHRTEHGAVEVNVAGADLAAAVERMRAIAARDGMADTVAVQPMIAGVGEGFIGVDSSELGPLVAYGIGGVLVEAINRIGGRMAPLTREDADALIEEFRDVKLMHGFRGQAPWNLDRLAEILVSVGELAAGSAQWLRSLDINPLIVTEEGFFAVDALAILKEDS